MVGSSRDAKKARALREPRRDRSAARGRPLSRRPQDPPPGDDGAERLRAAQRLQEAILDSIPDMAWLKDVESRFLAVNKRLETVSGLRRDQLLGGTDHAFLPRELAERYQADDREVIRTRATKRIEEPFVDVRGEETWIETIKVPILNDRDEVIGTVGIARDITERKRAEEVLRRSHDELERLVHARTRQLEEANEALRADIAGRIEAERTQRRLSAILEATPDLVAISDVQGRVQYMNGAGRRLVKLAEDADVTQHRVPDFYPPDEAARIRNVGLPAAIRDGAWSTEITVRAADGSEIDASQLLLVHRGRSGEPEFFSTLIRDERERRALEADLLQAQKMEGIGRLAGGIAHDFNNLLTAILGYVELARAKLGPDDPARVDLEEIRSAGERAAELTRGLLAFARKQRIEPRVVDLNQLLLSTDGLLRRLIGAHIELVTVPSPVPLLVTIDTAQFQQILVNLAVNARDAMQDGGRLTIEMHPTEIDWREPPHRALAPGAYARVAIRDTGLGMDEEVLAHLFEPFFTTKETGAGTGLGLATCYGIVRQAGGHIGVTSRLGAGTCFEIHLPRAAEGAAEQAAPPTPDAALRGGSETILLVEDEPQVRAMAAQALRAHGYRVLVASSAGEALAVARAHDAAIDLLLSDVVMPHGSGPQLAERLREERPGIPVLFISGYAGAVNLSAGVLSADVPLLAKPFTPEALVRRVRAELDRA